MKKVVALLLATLLLCGVCACALAQTSYTRTKTKLIPLLEEFASAKSLSVDLEETYAEDTVIAIVDMENDSFFLVGLKDDGTPEATYMNLDGDVYTFTTFIFLCQQWDTYAGCMTGGDHFEIWLNTEDDVVTIDTAEKAQGTMDLFYDTLGE